MSIIETIKTPTAFRDRFVAMGRSEQFSYRAFDALFEFYSDFSDQMGEPFMLDVVAICCDWTEYDSIDEAAADFDDVLNTTPDDLREHTTVLDVDGGHVLVQAF